jgi:hypothetical protein
MIIEKSIKPLKYNESKKIVFYFLISIDRRLIREYN